MRPNNRKALDRMVGADSGTKPHPLAEKLIEDSERILSRRCNQTEFRWETMAMGLACLAAHSPEALKPVPLPPKWSIVKEHTPIFFDDGKKEREGFFMTETEEGKLVISLVGESKDRVVEAGRVRVA